MKEYTDEDILNMKKITCKIASDYLGIPAMAVAVGMRREKLPIGIAVKRDGSSCWSYYIIAERLVAYKHGNLNEKLTEEIEKKLDKIIENFALFRDDLLTLLKSKK